MNLLQTAAIVFHVLIAVGIVGLVLLQRGRGADAGAGFGSGASGTVFGARGSSSFLSRATATLAALFFATNLTLAYMGGRRVETPSSVVDKIQAPANAEENQPPPLPSAPATESTTQQPEAPAVPAEDQTQAPK